MTEKGGRGSALEKFSNFNTIIGTALVIEGVVHVYQGYKSKDQIITTTGFHQINSGFLFLTFGATTADKFEAEIKS